MTSSEIRALQDMADDDFAEVRRDFMERVKNKHLIKRREEIIRVAEKLIDDGVEECRANLMAKGLVGGRSTYMPGFMSNSSTGTSISSNAFGTPVNGGYFYNEIIDHGDVEKQKTEEEKMADVKNCFYYASSMDSLSDYFGVRSNSLGSTFLKGLEARTVQPKRLVGATVVVRFETVEGMPFPGKELSKDIFEKIALHCKLRFSGGSCIIGVIQEEQSPEFAIALSNKLGTYWYFKQINLPDEVEEVV